jgi:stage V sporulation protein AE
MEFAGAGVTVPLTGFGNALAEGVRKAVTEQGAIGILTGGITACAGGITAAIVFSFAAALVTKSKEK